MDCFAHPYVGICNLDGLICRICNSSVLAIGITIAYTCVSGITNPALRDANVNARRV